MEFLTYEVRDRIARITMNRPDKLNAINPEMRASSCSRRSRTSSATRTSGWRSSPGTGRAFSVGHDLVSMAARAIPGGGPGERTTDDLYLYLTQYLQTDHRGDQRHVHGAGWRAGALVGHQDRGRHGPVRLAAGEARDLLDQRPAACSLTRCRTTWRWNC